MAKREARHGSPLIRLTTRAGGAGEDPALWADREPALDGV